MQTGSDIYEMQDLKLKTMEPQTQEPQTLEEILDDVVALQYFKRFCTKSLSEEHVKFYLDVKDFLKNATNDALKHIHGLKLFDMYIKQGAELEVNISDETRTLLKKSLENIAPDGFADSSTNEGDISAFETALREVRHLMETDLLPRFKQSKYFAKFNEISRKSYNYGEISKLCNSFNMDLTEKDMLRSIVQNNWKVRATPHRASVGTPIIRMKSQRRITAKKVPKGLNE